MSSFPSVDFYKTDNKLPPIEVFALDAFYALTKGKSSPKGSVLSKGKQDNHQEVVPSPMDPHRVNFYSVILLTQGVVTHWIDDTLYTLNQGNALVVSPLQVQKFVHPSQAVKGYIVIFTESVWEYIKKSVGVDFIRVSYWNMVISPIHTCSPSTLKSCDGLLNSLLQEQRETNIDAKLQLLLFAGFIRLLTRDWPQVDEIDHNKSFWLFNRFTVLLAQCYKQSRDAQFYAEQLNVSYKMLNQTCKSVASLTAKRVIDDFVMLEAKRRLLLDNTSTKELAYELGFDESTNFVKFFKRHTGKTPKQFMTIW